MHEKLVKRLRDISNSDSNIQSNYIGLTMLQAADAIEELQRQIDAWVEPERKALIKSLPKWIPVTERLPEKSCKCLVYTERGEYGGYDITSYSEMTMTFLDYEIGCEKVTHWMPLPEPPKEEK